jgi:hypothetical protein
MVNLVHPVVLQIFCKLFASFSKFIAWNLQTFPKILFAVLGDFKELRAAKAFLRISKFFRGRGLRGLA